ncbi:MAG: hypothetical protein ACYDCP_05400 [Thermoplasmataceae archaeon]
MPTQLEQITPSNLSSVNPYWFVNGAYANYSFSIRSSSMSGKFNVNMSIFNISTNGTYSLETVLSNSTIYSKTYVNNTLLSDSNGLLMSFGNQTTTSFPAITTEALYYFDTGLMPSNLSMSVESNVSFTVNATTYKSDKVTLSNSSIPGNISYYVSYDTGILLNESINTTGVELSGQIVATNVHSPGHPPFPIGARTRKSYTEFKISSVNSSTGSFTVNVSGTADLFSSGTGSSSNASFNGTFTDPPSSFMALNVTNLAEVNAGELPAVFKGINSTKVITKTTITVLAGTFVTDEVIGTNQSNQMNLSVAVYIDTTSGIMTRETLMASGDGFFEIVNMSLSATNIPMSPTGYGFLTGSVTPSGATLVVNGIILPVYQGTYNMSLKPGTYYLSATMNGYQGRIYNVTITAGKATHENVALSRISNSVTLSGRVTPMGSSVLVNGYMADVNATGYYSISVPAGKYTVSVYYDGYFPMSRNLSISSSMIVNFNLVKEPTAANSSVTYNSTTANGYNVTVSRIANGNGLISVNFTATTNGTMTVSVPYKDMRNTTIAEILNSYVYINGVRDKNFSVTFTSNYTVILTVYNLSGDPTLYWTYSPSAVLPSSPPSTSPSSSPSLLKVIVIVGAIAVVIAIVGIVVARKRK